MRAQIHVPKKQPRKPKPLRWRVRLGGVVLVRGSPCRCSAMTEHGYIMSLVEDPGVEFPLTWEELAWIHGQYSFRF